MRRRIIEALTYPRMVLLADLNTDECPDQLNFNPIGDECRVCDRSTECHWLTSNDEFKVLAQAPMNSLYESLQFCIDYVDAQCAREKHNVRRCPCESCRWVRNARQLESDYRHKSRSHRRQISTYTVSRLA